MALVKRWVMKVGAICWHQSLCRLHSSITLSHTMMDPREFDRDSVLSRIHSKCSVENTCILYDFQQQGKINEYRRHRFKRVSGQEKKEYVHRLYFALQNFIILPSSRIWQVSHRCGVKSCINLQHLSLEPVGVNKGRNSCHRNKKCHGQHCGYPNCIITNLY